MKILFTRNVKWFVAGFIVLMTTAAIPMTAEAFDTQWSGIGPRLEINGQELYAKVDWMEGHTCDIDGPLKVKIVVPKNSSYTLRGESAGRFDCNGDGIFDNTLMTQTTIVEGRQQRRVRVVTKVNSPGKEFPTRIVLFKNSHLARVCAGESNEIIKCRGPRF